MQEVQSHWTGGLSSDEGLALGSAFLGFMVMHKGDFSEDYINWWAGQAGPLGTVMHCSKFSVGAVLSSSIPAGHCSFTRPFSHRQCVRSSFATLG